MDTMNKTQSCTNCTYAVFDPAWGEFKCSEKGRYCTEDEMYHNNCDMYNEGKPTTSKERRDYEDENKDA